MCAVVLTVTVVIIASCGCTKGDAVPPGHSGHPVEYVRVLAFTSSQCGPCKRAKPFLLSLRADGVDVRIVDVDENPDLAKQYGVKSVPTFFVYVGNYQPTRVENIWSVILLIEDRGRR